MLFLKQPLIFPFLCHKSATTCQIDSNKVSTSKLKPDLCNCVKIQIIQSTAPPQQPNKRDTNCLGHAVQRRNQVDLQNCRFLYAGFTVSQITNEHLKPEVANTIYLTFLLSH